MPSSVARSGSVLMNMPSMCSDPSVPCKRPDMTVPNTTSVREHAAPTTSAQAA